MTNNRALIFYIQVLLAGLTQAQGRNVALGQVTSQSSTLFYKNVNYPPDLAVDGKNDNVFEHNSCTATTNSTNPFWSVIISPPATVYRYVLYNRVDLQDRLRGFTLTSFDVNNVQVYNYTDTTGRDQDVYTLLPTTPNKSVSRVNIQLNKTNFLTLCEVEIYGETECVAGKYGQKCNGTCNCANTAEACNVSTGGCLSGCAVGYHGEDCQQPCPEGKYGQGCMFNCSKTCVSGSPRTCHHVNGSCLLGCKDGYLGDKCENKCPDGTFGKDCKFNCSENCEANTPLCNHINGTCLNGCRDGYILSRCNQSCPSGKYGKGCSFSCSKFCAPDSSGSSACRHTDGSCPNGCLAGYNGAKCETNCTAGKFGEGCRNDCSRNCVLGNSSIPECDHITGTCECQSGYGTAWCNQSCQAGTFGQDCSSNCSQFCVLNNMNVPECDHVNGTCGCQSGYDTPWCNTTCPAGTFGQDCKFTCSPYCELNRNETCDHINGSCDCSSGYTCAAPIKGTTPIPAPVGAIVGAVLGGVAAAVVVAVVVFILWRRRKAKPSQANGDSRSRDFSVKSNGNKQRFSKTELNNMGKLTASGSDAGVYYNTLPVQSSTIIQLQDLETFLSTHNSSFYQEQFSAIPTNNEASTKIAEKPENKNKNRYKNICAYDHSRVHLMSRGNRAQGDYINASHIQGYNGENFIAAQGPKESTLEDFVCMLWEQNTEEVVMLTNLVEQGKGKSERYWPKDGEMKVGEITVKLTTSHVFADYTIRRLQLVKAGEPDHVVTHFHFTAWPDRDVPLTPWGLVDFEQRVATYLTSKPIVVHCSAGVGRTGTFIALRNVMRQAADKGYLDIFTTVQKLRHDRVNMVQTAIQYQFLHQAAQVAMLCMGTTVTSGDIENRINYLEKVSDSGLTNMEKEFQTICNLSNDDVDKVVEEEDGINVYENSTAVTNKHKNRLGNIIPKSLYTPILQCETDYLGDYINAVFVPSFSKQNQQFLTQLPLPTTVTDFWRLVTQYKVSLIVSFEDDLKATDQTIGDYLPPSDKQAVNFSLFELESETVFTSKLWQQRKVTITSDTEYKNSKLSTSAALQEEHVVKHLKCMTTDLDPEQLLALITEIRSLNPGSKSRTVYMCRNGADYNGLVCVLSLLMDRMEHDGCLTVPLVVGAVKAIRPQVIPTLAQYQLLYQVLRLYSDRNSVYANLEHTK